MAGAFIFIRHWVFTFLLAAVFLFVFAGSAAAAGFKFSPPTGNFETGVAFAVTLSIDSEGTAINAAEATIGFPVRFLEVASISTGGSIFKFWAQEPTFSNSAGTISFSGGLPSPGYSGASGKIFTINFRPRGAGQASLDVSSGAILANDGQGTNVLTSSQATNYQIKTASVDGLPPVDVESEVFGLPERPVISSKTHPNESGWFNLQEFSASWNLPTGVDGVNYALWSSASYSLPASSKGLLKETTYNLEPLNDGVWYFFARFRNANGWGPTARRTVQIDRSAPEIKNFAEEARSDLTDPRPKLPLTADDKTSGIASARMKVDSGQWFDVANLEQPTVGTYLLPPQPPGERSVALRVTDRAGNFAEAGLKVFVKSLPTPAIENYSRRASPPQEPLKIDASVQKPADSASFLERLEYKIRFWLRKGNKIINFEVPLGSEWRVSADYRERLEKGSYLLTAQLVDSRGATSFETEAVGVEIGGWLSDILTVVGEYAAVIVAGIIAIGLIAATFFFAYSRTLMLRRRFLSEIERFEKKLEKDRVHLKADLRERRDKTLNLSEGARRAKRRHLAEDIQKIESDVAEEVEKIKKLEE